MKTFQSIINEKDEFEAFKTMMRNIKQTSPQYFSEIYTSLPQMKQEFFKEIMLSQKITLEGNDKMTARKFVKVKGRKAK